MANEIDVCAPVREELEASTLASSRLVEIALEGLSSFFVDTPEYVGFARDSSSEKETGWISTGSLRVNSGILQLKDYFPRLEASIRSDLLKDIENKAQKSLYFFTDVNNALVFSNTFGETNNLFRDSELAFQFNASDRLGARAQFFSAQAIQSANRIWEDPNGPTALHPYIALYAHKSLSAMIKAGATFPDPLMSHLKKADLNLKGMTSLTKLFPKRLEHLISLETAAGGFAGIAQPYLLMQLAHSVRGAKGGGSLDYDPVGACFALNLLIDATLAVAKDSSDFVQSISAEEDLIEQSVQHIFSCVDKQGRLPWGVPFLYRSSGLGAFATSISGLAALLRSLHVLVHEARLTGYANGHFVESLISRSGVLAVLEGVLPTLLGTMQKTNSAGPTARLFKGWSTDRARSKSRVESWYTLDVLAFALHSKLFLEEVSQFSVSKKYSGSKVIDAPVWPYDWSNVAIEPKTVSGAFIDPDELPDKKDPSAIDTNAGLSPVPFLHNAFRHLMDPSNVSWKQPVSSVLLYGPPGTAKSTLARSLASELGWDFFELTPSNFISEGIEGIESSSTKIFKDLSALHEAVILFDELDSLLVDRDSLDPNSILNFTVPAMLPKLQSLAKRGRSQRLLLVFATNYYERLDVAMVRRGRVDAKLLVLPYNRTARERFYTSSGAISEPALLEKAIGESSLAVFEDLRFFEEAIAATGMNARAEVSIDAGWYGSRIPSETSEANVRDRSLQRLYSEVVDVCRRRLGEERTTRSSEGMKTVLTDLEAIVPMLSSNDDREWRELCQSMLRVIN